MGDADDGAVFLPDPAGQQVEYAPAVVDIELLGWLIEQAEGSVLGMELSQPHQLLLTTGKGGKVAGGQVRHPALVERCGGLGVIGGSPGLVPALATEAPLQDQVEDGDTEPYVGTLREPGEQAGRGRVRGKGLAIERKGAGERGKLAGKDP